uniref:Uncharacterized protein n=1 Tax=Cannabis sativa TaxID=3483 RepID=A0A803P3F0_CANSA
MVVMVKLVGLADFVDLRRKARTQPLRVKHQAFSSSPDGEVEGSSLLAFFKARSLKSLSSSPPRSASMASRLRVWPQAATCPPPSRPHGCHASPRPPLLGFLGTGFRLMRPPSVEPPLWSSKAFRQTNRREGSSAASSMPRTGHDETMIDQGLGKAVGLDSNLKKETRMRSEISKGGMNYKYSPAAIANDVLDLVSEFNYGVSLSERVSGRQSWAGHLSEGLPTLCNCILSFG